MQKQVLCFVLLIVFGFWCHAQVTTTEPSISNSKYAKCQVATFPQPPCCGAQIEEKRLRGRIYGGRETELNEFPWLVYIDIRQILVNGIPDFCAGSLINTRWVLSAAHCFVNPNIHLPETIPLHFGEWNLNTEIDCDHDGHCAPPVVKVNIDKVFAHELYDPQNHDYEFDISLLLLKSPVNYTAYIQPICLPWDGLLDHKNLVGKFAEVAGWGRTEFNAKGSPIKMKTKVKVRELMDCPSDHSEYPWSYLSRSNQIIRQHHQSRDSKKICAGGEEGVDSCLGDSGGPLMMKLHTSQDGHPVNDNSPFYEIGLVSYSQVCGNAGEPGVYTPISSYLKWIRETIRRNS